jgi:hypothetical protein
VKQHITKSTCKLIIDINSMAPFSKHEEGIFMDDASSTSSSSSSTCLTPPAKRNVSFSPQVALHCVLHINDFSLAEVRDSWYGSDDMSRIRQDWKDTVALLDREAEIDEEAIQKCARGLEGKTRAGRNTRKAARGDCLSIVLEEQMFQEMDGVPDPIMIAMAYSERTFPLYEEAVRRAAHDHTEARIIYNLPELENDSVVVPTKFDFDSVRSMHLFEKSNDDDDETVATTVTFFDGKSKLKEQGTLLGLKIRNRFACILPITPKRYARRNTFK